MTTNALTSNAGYAVRSSDGAVVPWNRTNNQPLDIGGLAARIWIADGLPRPSRRRQR
jgi:hypothetical protein